MMWLDALLEVLGIRRGRPFRVACSLLVQVEREGHEVIRGKAINLSNRGVRVRLNDPLISGQHVILHLFGEVRPHASISVEGKVIWTRGHDAGLEVTGFGDTQYDDVVKFFRHEVRLEMHETASRLRSPRVMRSYPLKVFTFGPSRPVMGVVTNLSATGIRFKCDEPADPGEWLRVTVELPHSHRTITLHATVRRCRPEDDGTWDVAATIRPGGKADRELLREELTLRSSD